MAYDLAAAIDEVAETSPTMLAPTPRVPGLELHVDGDYLAYYASGNDDTSQGTARQNALDLIDAFKARTGADSVIVHMTANGCQKGERYLIATVKPYQGQRSDGRKPKNQPYLNDWLQSYTGSAFKVKTWATREADDGIAACSHYGIGKKPGYIAIATADKDMRMLPGLHIDWKSMELIRVNPGDYDVVGPENGKQYGLKFFWMQMLMGDTADHIPGLPGYATWSKEKTPVRVFKPMGEKTAAKFLADCKDNASAYAVVCSLYRDFYDEHPQHKSNWMDRFCEQAALLWMRCCPGDDVIDFANHAGHSCLSHAFCDHMWAAAKRLEKRIEDQRNTLNSRADRAD